MDMTLQTHWTERWEGRRSVAYDDATGDPVRPGVPVKGNPTIGVGLNLLTAAAHIAILGLGLTYQDVLAGRVALTDQQIDQLLTGSLNAAIGDARLLFPDFDQYPANAHIVIVDLCFNMGRGKLATFTHTCAAIKAQNWEAAAGHLRASEWFTEVGSKPNERGGADVAVLAGTVQPEDVLAS